MNFELILWQTVFTIYVTLHALANARRYLAERKKQHRYQKHVKRGWF